MENKTWKSFLPKLKSSQKAWCVLGVIFLASLPLFTEYCTTGKELAFHLRRIENMKDALLQGGFMMREGSVFLILPALLRIGGMSVQGAYKVCLFFSNVITACLGYWCFHKIFSDKVTAFIGCMLYAWVPYRFDLLYCRAAFGEIAAYSFFPLVLCGLYQIFTGDTDTKEYKYVWLMPAAGYTFIVQANMLSFFLAVVFGMLLCVVCYKWMLERKRVLCLGKMTAGFLVVNGYYLFSVLKHLARGEGNLWHGAGFIQSKGIFVLHFIRIFFRYGEKDVYQESGLNWGEPIGIGFAVTVCLAVYLWILFTTREKETEKDRAWEMGRGLLLLGIVFVLLSLHSFPWDRLSTCGTVFAHLIALLQSPAKWMILVILIFVFISCLTIREIKIRYPAVWKYYAAAVIVTAVLTTQFLTGDIIRNNGKTSIVTEADIPEVVFEGSEYLP